MERTHLLTSFQDFGLADPISRALKEENYLTPTPIQAQTIPLAMTGRDIVGIAQTIGAFDIGGQRWDQLFNLAIPYDCSGGTSLFASLITRTGHTFFTANTDITLVVWVERN